MHLSLHLIMQFLKDLFLGLRSYWKAILFIKTHKIYWYILIPAVFMIGIYKLGEMIKAKQYTPHVSNMNEIVWFMLQLLLEISIALLLLNFAKYLVVIILSPLLAHLSQKTEHKLTGNIYPFEMGQFLKDIRRGVRIALRNLLWQYLFFLIIFVVSFLGWKDPKSSPVFYLIFGIAFYYYGFSFIDYVNERRKLNINESVLFVRSHWGLAISLGAVYSSMILVPVNLGIIFSLTGFGEKNVLLSIGELLLHVLLWIAASAAPILAIVASTIAMNDLVSLKKKR
jgi:CysZ protein